MFDTNRDCYEFDTRQNMNIHMYQVNLAKYGNGGLSHGCKDLQWTS
jgi:hypothetical protein